MSKTCDHKSVGTLIRNNGETAVIMRGNYPAPCISLPAGHCDLRSYAEMAVTETMEETGLLLPMRDLAMVYEGTTCTSCRREGGSWHDWRIYRFVGELPTTELKAGDDAIKAFWADGERWRHYAIRTEWFISKLELNWIEAGTLTNRIFGRPGIGPATDEERALYEEWCRDPGMEPVCYFMMRMIGDFPWTFQNAPTVPQ